MVVVTSYRPQQQATVSKTQRSSKQTASAYRGCVRFQIVHHQIVSVVVSASRESWEHKLDEKTRKSLHKQTPISELNAWPQQRTPKTHTQNVTRELQLPSGTTHATRTPLTSTARKIVHLRPRMYCWTMLTSRPTNAQPRRRPLDGRKMAASSMSTIRERSTPNMPAGGGRENHTFSLHTQNAQSRWKTASDTRAPHHAHRHTPNQISFGCHVLNGLHRLSLRMQRSVDG